MKVKPQTDNRVLGTQGYRWVKAMKAILSRTNSRATVSEIFNDGHGRNVSQHIAPDLSE